MAKGGSYERDVAKTLTRWLNPDGTEKPIQLWRSNLSGGWSGRELADVGDLAPKDQLGFEFRSYFGVECKHWRDISFWGIFTHDSPMILGWWDKLREECEEYDICPLLIMKRSRYAELIGFPSALIPLSGPAYASIEYKKSIVLPHAGITFILFSEFLWTFNPSRLYALVDIWRQR